MEGQPETDARIEALDKELAAKNRELEIEAALEKVRSRSLAMHKSDELREVVVVVLEKLQELRITMVERSAIIIEFEEGSNDFIQWVASPQHASSLRLRTPYFETVILSDFRKAKEKGINFYTKSYSVEEKNSFFKYFFDHAGQTIPEEEKKWILSCKHYDVSVAIEKNSATIIANHSGELVSEEENQILKRFARVFEQAYIRFLDLQKAEAQAREAQIEAALEKVRSRSLAMHHSNELEQVAASLFDRLAELGLSFDDAFIFLFEKEKRNIQLWIASTYSSPHKIELPYDKEIENNAITKDLWHAIENGEHILNRSYSGETKNDYFRYVWKYNEAKIPESIRQIHIEGDWIESLVAEKNSIIGVDSWSGHLTSDEDFQILIRFARVFEQAYTRFLDLQKAEAQTREAIKRASVDRVRAEIASMRTTNDLERITPLIWNELTTLGVPFIRCGVFIMDEEQQQIETHLSTPDGEAIAAFNLPYNAPGETAQILPHWYKKELYKQHWNEAQFVEFTQNLARQGRITSGEKYLTENHPTDLYLHFLPFLQGMLYVGNTEPLSDDALQLMQNLADAFSTAYARYEDFNKLEAAKQLVEKTLVDLRQAQQQLIQSEKMASLGELTAGIAHEIQNPLNFVNNFSEVNTELIDEMQQALKAGNTEEAFSISNDLKDNEQKIIHHGKRADSIVKGMLQHSRVSTGQKELTDINALADEYLRLSYHGMRAKDKSFNATLQTDFDASFGKINVVPQDMGRVLLNLFNNAFLCSNAKEERSRRKL